MPSHAVRVVIVVAVLVAIPLTALLGVDLPGAGLPAPKRIPLRRSVDLDVGELSTVELSDGSKATLRLLALRETRDDIRGAVRRAVVDVEVNDERISLVAAMYHLPRAVAGVRIDCPITKGYTANSRSNVWALEKDARLRLWPAGSPAARPETFRYPARQRWFATDTQMANDPCYVDASEEPGSEKIYYHYGLDIGGAEGLVEVVAATSGLVVSRAGDVLAGHEKSPVSSRYDVVYLVDGRGWYYRYSHLKTIAPAVLLGGRVEIGQKIGVVGKEGGSGGWTHLHFDITARQPGGSWGIEEGYAFLWEAYLRERSPELIAVARPHHVARVGQTVVLDGSRSWSAAGGDLRYEWTLTSGRRTTGPRVEHTYGSPGEYSEILRVTDGSGRVAYDFAVVQVFDREEPRPIATIHAVYFPTEGIRPGDPVTFKVRSFGRADGEVWDFGDGSSPVRVHSDGNAVMHAPDGYAVTTHRFEKPGDYIVSVERVVSVERAGGDGTKATARLHVRVEGKEPADEPTDR